MKFTGKPFFVKIGFPVPFPKKLLPCITHNIFKNKKSTAAAIKFESAVFLFSGITNIGFLFCMGYGEPFFFFREKKKGSP